MPTLDPRFRCMGCGVPLADEAVVECPNCEAKLETVGRWNEVLGWGETRKKGRFGYLVWKALEGAATGAAVGVAHYFAHQQQRPRAATIVFSIEFFGGIVGAMLYGWFHWRLAERQYEEAGSPVLNSDSTGSVS